MLHAEEAAAPDPPHPARSTMSSSAVERAPEDEGPARPCHSPQSRNTTEVQVGPPRARAVPAQRQVQVVPEPAGERDVPAPPELGDRPRDVRVVEVLQEVEAEHPCQADGHVRVAGEVEVDLQACSRRCPARRARRRGRAGSRANTCRRPRPRCSPPASSWRSPPQTAGPLGEVRGRERAGATSSSAMSW